MTESAGILEGVSLSSLEEGTVIDLETRRRHYRIEYLGGNKAWISGHPEYCPTPVLVKLEGSTGHNTVEPGFIGQGMHLVFRRMDDHVPVTTSEVTGIRIVTRV